MTDIDNILLESIKFNKIGIYNPTLKKMGEGGASGADVYLVTDSSNKKYILKVYSNDYYVKRKNRLFRELYVYENLLENFHYKNNRNKVVNIKDEKDASSLCKKNDTEGIGYPELLDHGEIHDLKKPNFYIIMTFIDGIVLSKSILPQNSQVWKDKNNIILFATFFLKSIRYLNSIFNNNFLHYDLHPDNVYVVFENNKLVKVILIDFDLVESNIPKFKTLQKNMSTRENIDLKTIRKYKQIEFIPYKTRAFVCYCFESFKITYNSKLSIDRSLCKPVILLIMDAKNIENYDIRNWFVLTCSLFYLSNSMNKEKKTIDLNRIYNSCFSNKHIDFNKFIDNYYKNNGLFLNSIIRNSTAKRVTSVIKTEQERRLKGDKHKKTRKNNK